MLPIGPFVVCSFGGVFTRLAVSRCSAASFECTLDVLWSLNLKTEDGGARTG